MEELLDMAHEADRVLRSALVDPRTISFAGGLPAIEAFPRDALTSAATAVLATPRMPASLQYGWPEGKLGLREWVAHRLRQRGADVSAEDVIITAGAQQALSMVTPLLVRKGTRVWVDRASYPSALELFRGRGAVLTDDVRSADCVYAMPGVANPCGTDTLRALGDALEHVRAPILADEAYAELRFDGRVPDALIARARDRVFHVGTVSKSLCPGLRIGWIVPPRELVQTLRTNKQLRDLQSGALVQAMLVRFLQTTDYEGHLRVVRRLYRARARYMVRALRAMFPEWRFAEPEGGFSVYVATGARIPDLALLRAATAQRVVYDPGFGFEADPGRRVELTLRLCYAAVPTARIDEGLARLRRAWDAALEHERTSSTKEPRFDAPRDSFVAMRHMPMRRAGT